MSSVAAASGLSGLPYATSFSGRIFVSGGGGSLELCGMERLVSGEWEFF